MENRANYFFVGLFVFGVFFASIAFILWLGGYSKEESFKYYEIHTQESVAGLGIKAPVRLLGVEVGSVEEISIENSKRLGVRLLIKVKKDTPIKEDTLATLQIQGITGLKFVQLLQGENEESKDLSATQGEIPTIPYKESFLATLDKQSEKIFSLVKRTDDKSKELLSEKNLKNLELLLQNLAELSANLNANSQNLSLNLSNASLKIGKMADDISLSARNFNSTLKDLKEGVVLLKALIKKTDTKLDSYDDIRISLGQNLELLQKLLIQSTSLIENLQSSPADLIFKESKPKPGPGEK